MDRIAPRLFSSARTAGSEPSRPPSPATASPAPAGVPAQALPAAVPDPLELPPPAQVDLERVVGQLVMAGMDGSQPDADLLQRVREGRLGGVLLFSSNVGPGLPGAMEAIQQAAAAGGGPPLLVATDQEGGTVSRLPGPPKSPGLMAGPADAEAEGAATAALLSGMHVNVDLAPVADVVSAGGFEAAQGRGFRGGSDQVALLASAFAKGLQTGRVAATAKHFPGIGSLGTSTDSKVGRLQVSPDQLQDQLKPFRRLASEQVDLVMLANAVCPAWDPDQPAVFSAPVVQALRQQVGYGGVVVTDDLGAPSLPGDPGLKAVKAVEAGADLVLFSSESDGSAAYQALLTAARSGRLAPARLLEAQRRLAQLRSKLVS